MSAIPIQDTDSVLAELPQPKGPGARLKAARKSRDIGLDTVAAQLHLRRDMLIALEEDDYDHLPARVFIVGYMRNYARYIGLPAEAIIQSLDQFLPPDNKDQPGLPKVGSDAGEVFKPSAKARKSPFSLLSLILLAAAVGAFFIWKEGYLDKLPTPPPVMSKGVDSELSENAIKPVIAIPAQLSDSPASVTEAEPVGAQETPVPLAVTVTETEAAVAETETIHTVSEAVAAEEPATETVLPESVSQEVIVEKQDEAVNTNPEPAITEESVELLAPVIVENTTPVVADNSGIVLKLTGKSWIEVRDASGSYKLNNLYNAGTEKTFGGEPPYKVLIGNVAEASLMVNGVEFDLENHNKANVARFTLDPSAL